MIEKFLRLRGFEILYNQSMSSFFSKSLGKIALMVAAVLWSGCSDVDKDSKNKKSVSSASNSFGVAELSNPVESSYSAALQDVKEKDSRDSLMKAFFPVERIGNVCKDNVYAGLRYDIGNLLKYGSVKKYGCIRRTRVNTSRGVIYVGVPEEYGLRSYPFPKDLVHPFSMTSELSVVGLVNAVKFKSNATAKVLFENIKSADNQTLNQEMYSRVAKVFRQKNPTLSHIYGMFLEGKTSNPFEGKITLMLTISADGTVKDALIISSTTGVKDFDENIINAVCRWTFSKVKSGEIVVYVTIIFYKEDGFLSKLK